MEEKRNKNKFLYILGIIALCIIIIMGLLNFKLYNDKKIANNLIKELNSRISNLENIVTEKQYLNDNENPVETLDVNNDLVQQLYRYILKSDNFTGSFAWQNGLEPASFYKNKKTNYSSLSNIEKMLAILQNYYESDIKNVFKTQVSNIIDISDIHNTVYIYENIEKKSMKIFNQNGVDWRSYTGCSYYLNYKNDCYYLSEFDGGGKGTSISTYSEIQKAEKDQEYIYIYDKFIYIDSTKFDLGEGDSKIHIYTSSDETNEIGTESSYPETIKELYNKYKGKLKTYKHIFKKSENDSYYTKCEQYVPTQEDMLAEDWVFVE